MLTDRKSLVPLEELLDKFRLSYEAALSDDSFIRRSVWNLSEKSPYKGEYVAFLAVTKPDFSVKYLIPALANSECADGSIEVLVLQGPSEYTVNHLVWALANPERQSNVSYVLSRYGPSLTVLPLLPSLEEGDARLDAAVGLFIGYKASRKTVRPLVGTLTSHPGRFTGVSRVLVAYGEKALQLILPPIPGTPLYGPLTKIINDIKSGAPART
ncbi:hypothetical protein HYU20_02280 [Candidatus Woesearchaeota archaeon]|nr:hypothetical protein [Candidatus Woesearchaeota archaeon]